MIGRKPRPPRAYIPTGAQKTVDAPRADTVQQAAFDAYIEATRQQFVPPPGSFALVSVTIFSPAVRPGNPPAAVAA